MTSLPSYLEKQGYLYRLNKARQLSARPRVFPADPADWVAANFHIPETNSTISLAPYQRAVLNEAFRRDSDGRYVYSTVVWSDIKKSAKSTIAAAAADLVARHTHYGSIRIVANDLKQADSRVAFYLRRHLELSGLPVQMKPSGYLITYSTRTRIEAVPIDPKGEAGGGDDLIIFSELWGANQTAALRMWTETTLSPLKFGHSLRWIETYAGYSGESPILEDLYHQGVKQGHLLDLGIPGLEVYANDAARLLVLWNTRLRLPWQTDAYYAQEAATLTPNEFERVHRNQWVSSTAAFIPFEWWEACGQGTPPLREYEELVLGVDAATTGDCFALVAWSRSGADYYLRYARKWSPPEGGGKINYDEPEQEIKRLCAQYNVICMAYDPYQLEDMAGRLTREIGVWCASIGQGAPRLQSDKLLYDLIRERRIHHSNESDLAEHIQNANAKTDPQEHTLRIIKRAPHLKVDLAVASAMAVFQLSTFNL